MVSRIIPFTPSASQLRVVVQGVVTPLPKPGRKQGRCRLVDNRHGIWAHRWDSTGYAPPVRGP
jgi:hypothetical protein